MIVSVNLIHHEKIEPGTLIDDLPVPERPDIFAFEVQTDDTELPFVVPSDPTNRHYQDVKEWYKKQKNKPFEFDFE